MITILRNKCNNSNNMTTNNAINLSSININNINIPSNKLNIDTQTTNKNDNIKLLIYQMAFH